MGPAGERGQGPVPGRLDRLWFGVVEVDDAGIVRSVNQAAIDALGVAHAPVVGELAPVEADWWRQALAHRDIDPATVRATLHRHVVDESVRRWLRLQAVAGREDGWVSVVVDDVSEAEDARLEASGAAAVRSRLAAELDDANAQLARTNAELRRFAGAVAHDLQGPISNILGFVTLLGEGGATRSAEEVEIVERLEKNAKRSAEMVSDLLAYARTAGSVADHETVDLRAVAEYAVDAKRIVLEAADAEVHIGPLPAVLGNEAALRQVMLNLVDNAAKYRRPDTPLVLDIRQAASHDPELVEIHVVDNGIGIAPQDRERVFDLGTRVGSGPDGSGIGLASCATVMRSLGGAIVAVEPTSGVGAEFVLLLPHAEVLDGPLAVDGTVMVVDDDDDVLQIARLLAASVGLEVVAEASSAADALAQFEALDRPPDILVLDLALGDGDGLDVARALLARAPQLRILLHSGLIDDAVADAARELGVAAFVGKGVGADSDFVDALRRLAEEAALDAGLA